jgi:GTPase involved in cell partitioning and DNA repair
LYRKERAVLGKPVFWLSLLPGKLRSLLTKYPFMIIESDKIFYLAACRGHNHILNWLTKTFVDMLFDLTDKESFLDIRRAWLKEINRYALEANVPILLVGTKADSKSHAVTDTEIEMLKKNTGIPYHPVSAKNTLNLQETVDNIVARAFAHQQKRIAEEAAKQQRHSPPKK